MHSRLGTPGRADEVGEFIPMGNKDEHTVFRRYSTGAKSNRDEIVYCFDQDALCNRVEGFAERYNREVDRYLRRHKSEGTMISSRTPLSSGAARSSSI